MSILNFKNGATSEPLQARMIKLFINDCDFLVFRFHQFRHVTFNVVAHIIISHGLVK